MIKSEIKKQLVKDLENLPYELQKKVQEFAHALLISQPQGSSGKDLLKFSGILEIKDGEKIMQAIEEGCGKVDHNEW